MGLLCLKEFNFGFGLSYTTFTYTALQLDKSTIKAGENLNLRFKLKNTGKYKGDEIVQLYLHDELASVARPVKELKGFQKVFLKAGETKLVSFTITPEDLKFYNGDLKYDWEPGEFKIMIGSNSRDVKSASINWVK